uniref:Carbohydrate kinase PfkB domain-containing protein n=1 Tax=Emiliania huxleyi TaxID=2903 RepID=A0A6T0DJ46_EMIHU
MVTPRTPSTSQPRGTCSRRSRRACARRGAASRRGGDHVTIHPCRQALLSAVAAARCVVHGSLALRAPVTRSTLVSVVGAAKRRVFDVNLRPPHVDEPAIASAAAGAWLIKLNDDELPELARMLGLEAGAVGDDAAERASAAQLATATGAAAVCVTRGAKGAALWVAGGEGEGEWSQHSGFAAAVDARDTIGAGDSFLASLILSLLPDEPASPGVRHELDATDALARACAIGAFVASMPGATPKHDADAIERIRAFAP